MMKKKRFTLPKGYALPSANIHLQIAHRRAYTIDHVFAYTPSETKTLTGPVQMIKELVTMKLRCGT